jgi:ABC-2 type transport system ATP-binding protein
MQQKIQFIAALLHEPELIIMDEPFSGLDPVNAQLLMDTLLDLRRQGRAVLFSTHRMDQVEKLCDNIALLHHGRLILSGPMREIKSSYPRNRIRIHYAGGEGFLEDPRIESLKRYPGYAEIKLRPSAALADDAQALLSEALQCARITHFEVTEPTLEQIFIEKVLEDSPGHDLDLALDRLEEPDGSYPDA